MKAQLFRQKNFHLDLDPGKWLLGLSLIYLGLPIIIFLLGWTKWPLAFPIIISLIFWGIKILKEREPSPLTASLSAEKILLWVFLFFLINVWVFFSGMGPLGSINHDFEKHQSLINDLVTQKWPVTYLTGFSGGEGPIAIKLVYCVGFYLLPCLLGKILGSGAVP